MSQKTFNNFFLGDGGRIARTMEWGTKVETESRWDGDRWDGDGGRVKMLRTL